MKVSDFDPRRPRLLPGALVIRQTDHDLALAARWEQEVLESLREKYDGQGENYTGLDTERQFYTGYRGELAAFAWLRRAEVPCQHRVVTNGNSQASEITINTRDRDYRLEVKTAGKPYPRHKNVMMPANQPTDFDLILGARKVDEYRMEICGWLLHQEFMQLHEIKMVRVLSRVCDARNQNQGGPLRPPLTLVEWAIQQTKKEPPTCITERQS